MIRFVSPNGRTRALGIALVEPSEAAMSEGWREMLDTYNTRWIADRYDFCVTDEEIGPGDRARRICEAFAERGVPVVSAETCPIKSFSKVPTRRSWVIATFINLILALVLAGELSEKERKAEETDPDAVTTPRVERSQ